MLKEKCHEWVVRKIYSEMKKKGNLQAIKKHRKGVTRVIHGQKQSNSLPKKEAQK